MSGTALTSTTQVQEDGTVDHKYFLGATEELYEPPGRVRNGAHVDSLDQYQTMYELSLKDPAAFWTPIARQLHFHRLWDSFCDFNIDVRKGPVSIRYMDGAKLNVAYNCVDRHVEAGLGDKVAFFWEGNDPADCSKITFKELRTEICKFSNVLKSKGVRKGDRVAIYLPMIPELPVVMLACARIGAIHSIVFGGFSAESLGLRIVDAEAGILVTADGVWRGAKLIPLKQIADEAMAVASRNNHSVRHCIVVRHLGPDPNAPSVDTQERPGSRPCFSLKADFNPSVDVWYGEEMKGVSADCPVEWMEAEDPLFMLYTSGSTGKPKGVLHTQAGYLLYTYATFRYVFDHRREEDVYWCTADIGWITGHSYVVYGPLADAATGVLFEGTPFFPDASRMWQIVDKYRVSKFYTAPTAIRALMKYGEVPVRKCSRESLRVLGTVGEPINPEAWLWYCNVVGNGGCAVVDTYWQTETGGHLLTPLPGATPTKPGSATFPFFGVQPAILTDDGQEIEGPGDGNLAFKGPWPGLMRTVFKNHQRFQDTYFAKFPGYYCSGDGCRRDQDGYYWVTGRVDDMMNVSGHLLSTAEIESALVSHKGVAEAAVVAAPHNIKGQSPYAFVTLKMGVEFSEGLNGELKEIVRSKIGPLAVPGVLQVAPGLPKTRSGKIMRRILRSVARGDEDTGDKSTIADPEVIDQLWANRVKGPIG